MYVRPSHLFFFSANNLAIYFFTLTYKNSGLVVHAAADGVALGAAATTNQTDVEMIVFLAIMLHKAPASFGLVTYLMHEGLERTKIRYLHFCENKMLYKFAQITIVGILSLYI